MMPAGYSMDTLPEPLDENVRLREVPGRRMVAIRYSGAWSERRYELSLERLRAWMADRQLKATGDPVWARYNSPFALWFVRRNEVLVPIAGAGEDPGKK